MTSRTNRERRPRSTGVARLVGVCTAAICTAALCTLGPAASALAQDGAQAKSGGGLRGPSSAGSIPEATAIALLREYEAAYASHDIERLSRTWRMNPLDRTMVTHMFREYRDLAIGLELGALRSSTVEPTLDFDQQISVARTRTGATPLRAHMARRVTGDWFITRLEVRRGPSIGVPTLAAQSRSEETRRQFPSGVLQEFQEAIQAQDIDRVSRIWVMNNAERAALESLFDRTPDTTSRVVLRGRMIGDTQATLDFDQRFRAASSLRIERTLARTELRAHFARDDRGEWYISKVTPRS
jgi:hypothetical protein